MALGNNHGTSSHIRDLKVTYMMASIVNDGDLMEKTIASINRSYYAESTKISAIKFLAKWEKSRE